MKVNDFPFGELLKKAWSWTYKNKRLWVIAFFAGSSGYFLNLVPDGENLQKLSENTGLGNLIDNTKAISNEAPVIVAVVALILVLVLFFYLIGLVARGAIIKSLGEINLDKKYRFWNLVSIGFKKMPRILLVGIMWGIPNLILMILVALGIFLGSWYGIALVSLCGFGFLIYNVYISILRHYVYCEAILNEKPAWLAIMSGVNVVNKNFWIVLVTALIQIGLAIAIGIGTFIAILILAIPFVLLGVILTLSLGSAGLVIPAVLGGLVLIGAVVVIRGAVSFYFNTFLTQVYWKLEK